MMTVILEALGISKLTLVTGAIGAAFAAIQGKGRSMGERVLNFMGGFVFALIMTKPIFVYFVIRPEDYAGGLGFALGYFGMALMDALVQALKALKEVDYKAIITGWISRGGGG